MCTVTVIPLGEPDRPRDGDAGPTPDRRAAPAPWSATLGFRLACNRDEARTRRPALPPRQVPYGRRIALHPVDGDRGGTWIAVNDAGLGLALLNRNAAGTRAGAPAAARPGDAPAPRPSRGAILPALLPAASVDEALERIAAIDLGPYAPFRAVLIDGREVGDIMWDGARRTGRRGPWSGDPLLFTSSGLGDDRVAAPRLDLFNTLVKPGRSSELAGRQDLFHRHSWPDQPHLSVCMRREDACTVSHTVIEVTAGVEARLAYHAGAPDMPATPVVATLRLAAGGAAR